MILATIMQYHPGDCCIEAIVWTLMNNLWLARIRLTILKMSQYPILFHENFSLNFSIQKFPGSLNHGRNSPNRGELVNIPIRNESTYPQRFLTHFTIFQRLVSYLYPELLSILLLLLPSSSFLLFSPSYCFASLLLFFCSPPPDLIE